MFRAQSAHHQEVSNLSNGKSERETDIKTAVKNSEKKNTAWITMFTAMMYKPNIKILESF